jgi:ferredoxin-NADP reductase
VERISEGGPISAKLLARQWLAPDILEFQLSRPADLSFIPGQYLRFAMDGYERDYTLVSGPDAETMDFCIAMMDKGRFSSDILKADMGAPLQLSGPYGYFVLHKSANPAVFVATGTGVAPFVAYCRSGAVDALLLHGVSTPGRLIYRDILHPALRGYVPCISQPFEIDNDLEEAFPGRVTDYLKQRLKTGIYDFYLCGRRTMIRDVAALIDEKFSGSRLFIETYD